VIAEHFRWFGRRPGGGDSEVSSEVVDFSKQKRRRAPRDLVPLDKSSGAARYFDKMQRDIIADLGGRRMISRIELELIDGYCDCATRRKYLTNQLLLGEPAEGDAASAATLVSTMLRVASRLGLSRRSRDVTPDFYKETLPRLAKQQETQPQDNGVDDDSVF
jgi:hypothetical protein